MKKIFIAIICAITIITITSCDDDLRKSNEIVNSFYEKYDSSAMVDSAAVVAHDFKYKGHDFIMFMNFNQDISVVHNPECHKCFQIFD